jgi:hypothetical protein
VKHLSDDLLREFLNDFLGYGNFRAPLWFIGMEEGGGNSLEEIEARLTAWNKRGQRHAEDLHDFCQATGHQALLPYATANAPYNKTWCGLIKHLHQRQGIPLESALEYQRIKWLTKGEDNCLLNLMPLPSPNVSTWHYSEWSDLPELQSRAIYLKTVAPKRIARLRRVIESFKPEHVVCVGTSYRDHWELLAEGISTTTFEIITHPAARSQSGAAPLASPRIDLRVPQSINAIPQDTDKVVRFFASGKPYVRIGTVGDLPIFIGYASGDLLCLELKQIQAQGQITYIVNNKETLEAALGQAIQWQATGKQGKGRGIFALYYRDRADKADSELAWAQRIYPLFMRAVQQITQG